jgi:catechol 2,3-dioxygenase-like lactoylglutathione lyase family enzyme
MLSNARVATRLPAQDLDRARRFYAEKLGLEPADERPGGLLYRRRAARLLKANLTPPPSLTPPPNLTPPY